MAKPYIFGRHNVACCKLIDELKSLGVAATVGHANAAKLYVYVKSESDIPRVPATFEGFAIETKLATH